MMLSRRVGRHYVDILRLVQLVHADPTRVGRPNMNMLPPHRNAERDQRFGFFLYDLVGEQKPRKSIGRYFITLEDSQMLCGPLR
jgi:hypothetical protein